MISHPGNAKEILIRCFLTQEMSKSKADNEGKSENEAGGQEAIHLYVDLSISFVGKREKASILYPPHVC